MKLFRGERLCQEWKLGIRRHQLGDFTARVRRHQNDRKPRVQVTSTLGQLASVHVWHNEIGQEKPDFTRVLLEISQGLPTISCRPGLVAQCTNNSAGDGARRLLVVHDENCRFCRKAGSPLSSRGHMGSWQHDHCLCPSPRREVARTLVRLTRTARNLGGQKQHRRDTGQPTAVNWRLATLRSCLSESFYDDAAAAFARPGSSNSGLCARPQSTEREACTLQEDAAAQ